MKTVINLKDRRIDKAIRKFDTAMKIYRLNKLRAELEQYPERFPAHVNKDSKPC